MGNPIKNNLESIEEMIEWLSSFGKTKNGGVTRLLYSEPWKKAQLALKEKMEQIGLDTYFDSVGNLFGKLCGSEQDSKRILTGSHIDTVVEGGRYDGAYGVAASILAVQKLMRLHGVPKKTIEVVSLCEEEGSRFPLAFWGSGNISGHYHLHDVMDLQDTEGIGFLEAMGQAGFSPDDYTPQVRTDVGHFIEVHIEQGTVLEKSGKTLGIVTDIVGQRRYTVTVTGENNHAGTTPMRFRKDALSTTADFISYLTKRAVETDQHLVATVGRMVAKPNVPNVIAGFVEFSLDIRHHQEAILESYCRNVFSYLNKLASELGIGVSVMKWMEVKPVKMDQKMNKTLRKIIKEMNISFQEMISGAGHDSQIFGQFCPTSLLFIPSKNGLSHSSEEFSKTEDLETGIEVLSELLFQLAF